MVRISSNVLGEIHLCTCGLDFPSEEAALDHIEIRAIMNSDEDHAVSRLLKVRVEKGRSDDE